jgi:hypothetical protein
MTLAQLRACHPERFYPNQTWFRGERFMKVDLEGPGLPPVDWVRGIPDEHDLLTDAVIIAQTYLHWPSFWAWRKRLKMITADTDAEGRMVYLCDNGHGLEIHRYLAPLTCPQCGASTLPPDYGVMLWR